MFDSQTLACARNFVDCDFFARVRFQLLGEHRLVPINLFFPLQDICAIFDFVTSGEVLGKDPLWSLRPLESAKTVQIESAADCKVCRRVRPSAKKTHKNYHCNHNYGAKSNFANLAAASPGTAIVPGSQLRKTQRNAWRSWSASGFSTSRTMKNLSGMFFYRQDAAGTWFGNYYSFLRNCTQFKIEFLKIFTTVERQQRAALLVETRTRHPNEGVPIFVDEMRRLFCRFLCEQ